MVIQEIFGINDAMRATCDWVAELGFFAVCPDLFWRLEPGVDLTDKTDAEWKKAFDLMNRFDQGKGHGGSEGDPCGVPRLSGCNGRAATMGYCLGGRLAFMMAEQSDADINISYYGVGLDGLLGDIGKIHAPLLVHIADEDKFFPPEGSCQGRRGREGQP